MKQFILTFILLLNFCFLSQAQKIRVAVAANAQFVAQELKKAFEQETDASVELIVNSSGKITAQIMQGAPYDVFLSADTKYPQALAQAGLTAGKPKVYAYGALVLWSNTKLDSNISLSLLRSNSIKQIAIANPQTAPYGEAAVMALKYYKIYKQVQPKLVYGESIAQVNQYVLSGAAEVGITAKSVVLEPAIKDKGHWIAIDKKAYPPIAQSAVLLTSAKTRNFKEAQQFYTFLFSKKAKVIFNKYGYTTL